MTSEEIIDGNKIIKEFMELWKEETSYLHHLPENGFTNDELLFHKSWDWLMPVVEKIESLGFETSMDKNGFFIRYHQSNTQAGLFIKDKIQAVWLAVVEFIKFNNGERK